MQEKSHSLVLTSQAATSIFSSPIFIFIHVLFADTHMLHIYPNEIDLRDLHIFF